MTGRARAWSVAAAGLTTAWLTLLLGAAAFPRPACAVEAIGPTANPIHPLFPVLDDAGRPFRESGGAISVRRTCSGCHDAAWIDAHNSHSACIPHAHCVECHFEGGELPRDSEAYDREGRLRREWLWLSAPSDRACARCHSAVMGTGDPVLIGADFEREAIPAGERRSSALTLETGVIVSGENLSESYLNLAGKSTLDHPWDAHARRLVGCTACHFSPNHPARSVGRDSMLAFLKADPRRLGLAEYLRRPDHRLVAAACESCHDPFQAHSFLPYRARHLQILDCAACHIPRPMGPAAQSIDATVVRADGAPRVEYRGMSREPGESLSAAYLAGYEPLLLATGPRGRLAPHNAIDRWQWVDSATGQPVSYEVVRRAFLESGSEVASGSKIAAASGGGAYRPEILDLFDTDRDGRLDDAEMRLDTEAKVDLVRSRLVALGVVDPVPRREVTLHLLAHGVMDGEQVLGDCERCHAPESRLMAALPLGWFAPAAADPRPELAVADQSRVRLRPSGGGWEITSPGAAALGLHLFGHARGGWSDRIGFLLFLLVLAGVAVHAGLRYRLTGRRPRHTAPTSRTCLYTRYERIWHWLMAGSVLVLVVSGLEVHLAGGAGSNSLARAVAVHNLFALVLLVNGFLSLFYHVTTAAIRQFVPSRQRLAARIADQARFYTRGIFLGQPHPSPRSPGRKLNPLQQVTYLALLNILFPLQAVTGILIWGVARWPWIAPTIGGLSLVAPLHNLGAWLFLSFIVLHVYLTTTGHTVLANIRAMIDGHDEIEVADPAHAGGTDA